MFIVPYILKKESPNSSTLWLFLTNGSAVWETDEENCSQEFIVENYLTPNGFFGKAKIIDKILYYKLDKRTDMSNFYTWAEFLEKEVEIPKTDLFRPFIWLGEEIGERDDWGWYEECEQISLGKIGLIQLWVDMKSLLKLKE
jgi:hypothetical protein